MTNRKNVYVRDEDQDRLREFESDDGNASELFSKSLKKYIDEKRDRKEREKAAQGKHGRIIVEPLEQDGSFRKKAFQGRWLVEQSSSTRDDAGLCWGVAETKLGKIVVVADDLGFEAPTLFKVMTVDEFRNDESVPPKIKADALQELDVEEYVEELDI